MAACFRPVKAGRTSAGSVVFTELRRDDVVETLWLRCGDCDGCHASSSESWASRIMHEASLNGPRNMFVTLTYDPENLPYRGDLTYPDFQGFMKRLRFNYPGVEIRFFMCGEYGALGRPHFHAIIFNLWFDDAKEFRKNERGDQYFNSETLTRLWGKGRCDFSRVTHESARYCAGYVNKKIKGDRGEMFYRRVDELGVYQLTPPFAHMSLRPGIGARWLEQFYGDVYNVYDAVLVDGRQVKPPRYYDKWFKKRAPDVFEAIQQERIAQGLAQRPETTKERLEVRAEVFRAKLRNLRRDLE